MAKTPSKSMTPHTEPIGTRRKKRIRPESADAPKLAGDDTKRAKSQTTAPESAAKNGTIDQYFTRAVRSKPADAQAPSRHTSVMNHHPTWSPSKENAVYVPLDISAICSGPGRVKFSGRISNVLEQDVRAQKAATASKLRYVLAVADGTGVIEVRYGVSSDNLGPLLIVFIGPAVLNGPQELTCKTKTGRIGCHPCNLRWAT